MSSSLERTRIDPSAGNAAGDILARGGAIQAIQTQYATAVAVQKPRVLKVVLEKCLQEAEIAAESVFYGWGSGKDRVEGPSKECAMIAARNWGNCAIEASKPIYETPTSYIITSAFIDLETGVTIERPFRQSKKWKIYGRMDDERKEDVRFQIGTSKSMRNVVLNALPVWLIDRMLEAGKKSVLEKIKKRIKDNGIEAVRKQVLDNLKKYGAKLQNIETKVGTDYKQWQAEELTLLTGDIRALANGEESADVLFPEPKKNETETASGKGLTPDDMKAGDPETHQGYEKPTPPAEEKKSTKKQPVDNSAMITAIQEIANRLSERTDDPGLQADILIAEWAGSDSAINLGMWPPKELPSIYAKAKTAEAEWVAAQ